MSFFGEEEKGLELYGKAAAIYEKEGRTETYEYAALLNNKAGTLYALKKYDEAERISEIDPEINVETHKTFYSPDTAAQFDFKKYDYIVDAVDTVTAKIELVIQAQKAGVPVISSMGAGNKLDQTAFVVADIYETSVCPLAKVMRRELKKRNVPALKTVYSKEPPAAPNNCC